jgi:hypothetical protein
LIKLTLGTDMRGDLVSNQHISDEIPLPDHQTTHKQYFKLVTWELPGSHITTLSEPSQNPIGKT